MAGFRVFLKFWLPVFLWMGLIFSASTDAMASHRTSRFLGPLIRWILPGLSEEAVDTLVFLIRKAAHVTEYAILAILVWRALRQPVRKDPRPWNWKLAGGAFLIGAAYAWTDEFHQSFVPSRGSSLWDVALDISGVALGIAVIFVLGKWMRKW